MLRSLLTVCSNILAEGGKKDWEPQEAENGSTAQTNSKLVPSRGSTGAQSPEILPVNCTVGRFLGVSCDQEIDSLIPWLWSVCLVDKQKEIISFPLTETRLPYSNNFNVQSAPTKEEVSGLTHVQVYGVKTWAYSLATSSLNWATNAQQLASGITRWLI